MKKIKIHLFIATSLLAALPALVIADFDKGMEFSNAGDHFASHREFFACSDDIRCQANLAFQYHTGQGVTQDFKKAFEWASKAAAAGSSYGQNTLGLLYLNGQGVTKNSPEAIKWFKMSSEQGNEYAKYNLGNVYLTGADVKKDEQEGFRFISEAAELGHAVSQRILANLYRDGVATSPDKKKAAAWYEKAANQGDAYAQNEIGLMYYEGIGVSKEQMVAMEWYEKAAKQNFLNAKFNLGQFYKSGPEHMRDPKKSFEYFMDAAKSGHVHAAEYVGHVYLNGGGGLVQANHKTAFDWYKKSAEGGNHGAQYLVGYMYALGTGVEQNFADAVFWLAASARVGNDVAPKTIKEYLPKLSAYTVIPKTASLRDKRDETSAVMGNVKAGQKVYRLTREDTYLGVYQPVGNQVGYIKSDSLKPVNTKSASTANAPQQAKSNFPPRPAGSPGKTVCATNCFNAQCFRTYSDGRQVKFTAKQVWDPLNNTFKFDSGSC